MQKNVAYFEVMSKKCLIVYVLSPELVPRNPKLVKFWLSQFEMIHEWDLRVQSKFPSESKKLFRQNLVINLMNLQELTNNIGGDLIGPIEHLPAKPLGYSCNVYRASISRMGRTQKLSADVERIGVEKNMRNYSKAS